MSHAHPGTLCSVGASTSDGLHAHRSVAPMGCSHRVKRSAPSHLGTLRLQAPAEQAEAAGPSAIEQAPVPACPTLPGFSLQRLALRCWRQQSWR